MYYDPRPWDERAFDATNGHGGWLAGLALTAFGLVSQAVHDGHCAACTAAVGNSVVYWLGLLTR